ncbi:DNA-binding response regulator [Blastopirellula marina]|uniref:DNA-binding response regulator n=1 Tax=Blastopirellula marina TaxID=124 RepID=A0A2S8EZI7_9BACT|nr:MULTISPECIES: response regulator transcription factor [Pirellulaceae]PQO25307.1 DNA-binding response regulator [Blastopirellula marina]RCS41740.1 DNA-binding response regulator [Bremerella cremea]
MPYKNATVYVVDDDQSVRNAKARLLKSVGLRVEVFSSARGFLDHKRADVPGCLLLDVRMPGLSGLDLQQELSDSKVDLPIVFISSFGDIPMSVRAIKAGAVDFLPKPVDDQVLLNAVGQAIDQHIRMRRDRSEVKDILERIESLTPREHEVLMLVCEGLMNKQIAGHLNISQPTVKVHRRHVMEKMGAASIADLVHMVDQSGVSTP